MGRTAATPCCKSGFNRRIHEDAACRVAADAYTYTRMLHGCAAGSRIAVGGGVGHARTRRRGLLPCPVGRPAQPGRAPRSSAGRRTSSWPSSVRRTWRGGLASGIAGEKSCGLHLQPYAGGGGDLITLDPALGYDGHGIGRSGMWSLQSLG